MKTIIFFLVGIAQAIAASETTMIGMRQVLETALVTPTRDHVMTLAKEISDNLRYKQLLGREEWEQTLLAQQALPNIPGHAQYFADLIEEERKPVAHLPANTGERVTYDFNRFRYFEIFKHLPSPETVKVLGTFLADERDFFAMRPIPGYPGQTYSGCPGNMSLAVSALNGLGVRQPPPMELHCADAVKLNLWREWYNQIKSGKLAFSFKGQTVEYRFKPDGTWVSTPIANPPDDAPKPPPPRPPAPPPAPAAVSDAATDAGGHSPAWPWLLGVALLGLPAAAWFLKARRRQ